MSVAEKLLTISNNIKEVYRSGEGAGSMGLDYDAVYAAGEKAERIRFWNAYQGGGVAKSYAYSFAGSNWTDETFWPVYDIVQEQNAYGGYMFYSSKITNLLQRLLDCSVTLDVSGSTSGAYMFSYSTVTEIPELNFSELCTKIGSAFLGCKSLRVIEKLKVNEKMEFISTFQQCAALETLIVEGVIGSNLTIHYTKVLSRESIESIVNALSSSASGLTLTLSSKAVATAFETESGKADGTTSDAWLALIAPKSNWTISLE